jgi:hypothetical protein
VRVKPSAVTSSVLALVLLAVPAVLIATGRPWASSDATPTSAAPAAAAPSPVAELTPSTAPTQVSAPEPKATRKPVIGSGGEIVRGTTLRLAPLDDSAERELQQKTEALLGAEAVVPVEPTTFRVSTFNLLGNSHTARGGDRKGWASGATRMRWAVSLVNGADVDVVGFQEFQGPQFRVFESIAGAAFDAYPGMSQGAGPVQNSIAWRTARWQLVESHLVMVPYFFGRMRPMPYVKLRSVATGQEVWFLNVHNPADKFGGAQRWRDRATTIEANLVNRLHSDGTPVILTGDLNDRERAFCSLTSRTTLEAANGGSSAGGCRPPAQMAVDWILGSSELEWPTYVKQQQGLVRRTTDHPFVWAQASLTPSSATP